MTTTRLLIGAAAVLILAAVVIVRCILRGIDITNNDDHHRG